MEDYCLMGTKFQFGKRKIVLDMDDGDGYTTVSIYLMLLNGTLKMVQMVNFITF